MAEKIGLEPAALDWWVFGLLRSLHISTYQVPDSSWEAVKVCSSWVEAQGLGDIRGLIILRKNHEVEPVIVV